MTVTDTPQVAPAETPTVALMYALADVRAARAAWDASTEDAHAAVQAGRRRASQIAARRRAEARTERLIAVAAAEEAGRELKAARRAAWLAAVARAVALGARHRDIEAVAGVSATTATDAIAAAREASCS